MPHCKFEIYRSPREMPIRPGHFEIDLVFLTGHVTYHVALSEKSPIFDELVAVFSKIIEQKTRFRCRSIISILSVLA